MRSEDIWQGILIILGIIATAMLLVFLQREISPEYRIYQDAFVELENFRSSYTGEKPAPFKVGIKQIVIPSETNGPPVIDRCISCHVALEIQDYSPTKIGRDINNNIILDQNGWPLKVPNDNFVWHKLNEKIADLKNQGQLTEAKNLENLKIAHVGEHEYDMEKVLAMHPLIGKETRPFEFHPVDTYGCVVCHNGNGRGLVTDRAHGAIYDGDYEISYEGPVPHFSESDAKNDPSFSKAYNEVPGERLIFQTTPLFVGKTVQAKCIQCHQPTSSRLTNALDNFEMGTARISNESKVLQNALKQEITTLTTLLSIKKEISSNGYGKTLEKLRKQSEDRTLPKEEINEINSQISSLQKWSANQALDKINQQIMGLVGSVEVAEEIEKKLNEDKDEDSIKRLLSTNTKEGNQGSLFEKVEALKKNKSAIDLFKETQSSLEGSSDLKTLSSFTTEIDALTKTYQRGQQLFINQACYACHRIAGFSRGGVGPDLTREGLKEPWFIKQSIVWPQADLRTSTMPNQRLDHDEVEQLVTFLLGQVGKNKVTSEVNYQEIVRAWEGGKKLPWEQPITPDEIFNLRAAMTVFATQGCAGCHKLEGFESNVGFVVEKEKRDGSFEKLYAEHEWFRELFPEEILGSRIVATIEKYQDEIHTRISPDVRKNSILEEIEKNYPKTLEAFYSNFKYALRAKNDTKDPKVIKEWQQTVYQMMMLYIQEYGLGRLIGPRLNWSGIFRNDEWLMQHFWNPAIHTPRSIMPIFPFDNSKFLSLTYMLDSLGKKNRERLREVWSKRGFNPEEAVQKLCSQCHGEFLHGNGPVAEWIYPIPKNLRNPIFLRNLTRERVIQSITHGVLGTPMPPWGEVAPDKDVGKTPILTENEIEQIADWLFNTLPGERVIEEEEVTKWRYTPEDFIKELKREGDIPNLPQFKIEDGTSRTKVLVLPTSFESTFASNIHNNITINEIFDVEPNPISGAEKNSYYIKKIYYTKENLRAGEDFFVLNCSVCHGKDADGSGIRAASMSEAKPRMLTNLDWLKTRDDLRMLRSIKYGVPGTAMTPWGDFTSALQRMQLVMYIRSLSQSQEEHSELADELYQAFDTTLWEIEKQRLEAYSEINKTQQEYEEVKRARKLSQENTNERVQLYEKEINLEEKLNLEKLQDKKYLDLMEQIKKEKAQYDELGKEVIDLNDPSLYKSLLTLISLNKGRFVKSDYTLPNESKIKDTAQQMLMQIDEKRASVGTKKEVESLEKLKNTLIFTIAEVQRLQKNQEKIWKEIKKKNHE
jgi:mono/diheme cytochrome c family protein